MLPALYTIFDDFGWTAKLEEEGEPEVAPSAP